MPGIPEGPPSMFAAMPLPRNTRLCFDVVAVTAVGTVLPVTVEGGGTIYAWWMLGTM